MVHFNGTQDEQLLMTAQYILENRALFTDPIIRWSEDFARGGISDETYRSLLDRQGLAPLPEGHTQMTQEQITQNQVGGVDFGNAFPLQTQQLIDLGTATTERSEDIERLSDAVALNASIREEQRQADNQQFLQQQELVTKQLESLGSAITEAGASKGITGFLGGLGTGSLIALAAVAFIMFKK